MTYILRPGARVARGATYLFVQNVVSTAIGIAYIFLLARLLPPPPSPEMGIFFVLFFVLGLVQVFGAFALPSASTKYVSQYLAEGSAERARSVVARVLQFSLLTSTLLSVSLFFSIELMPTAVPGKSMWAPLFRILALTSFFVIFHFQFGGFLQGSQRMKELAVVNLANTIVDKCVAIYLLYMGNGLYSVVYGWLAGYLLSTLLGLVLTVKFLGVLEKPHPMKPLINFSYPLYISGILVFIAGWVDQLFILPYMGEASLAYYGLATRAAAVPGLISLSIVTALFPQLSELHTRNGKESLRQAFHVSTRYTVLVSFPAILGLAALANPVIAIFAGVEYNEAVLPLALLCLAGLPGVLGAAINPILLTLERTRTALAITVISIFFNMAVSYFTLAYLNLGMMGPAWARIFASIVGLGLGVYLLRGNVEINFDKEALWKASVASIFMVIAVVSAEKLVFHWYLLPLYVAIGVAVYFFSLVALRTIKKRDIELLHDYLPVRLKQMAFWLDRMAIAE